jgi:integrase
MSLYKRSDSSAWWLNVEWKGYARIHISTGTPRKKLANEMLNTLKSLRSAGRRDLLGLIASRRLSLSDAHAAYMRDPDSLLRFETLEPSPVLGPFVERWREWLEGPAGISPHTKRRYRRQTIRRYVVSWGRVFDQMEKHSNTTLEELTSGAIASYRKARVGDKCSGRTVNRDLCAIQSFLTWCEEEMEMEIKRPKMVKEKESAGRERWLSAAEIEATKVGAEVNWWALFSTLIYTGMRVGEGQALRWGDVRLAEGQIAIHGAIHDLKTDSSDRDVPVPRPLAVILASHAIRHPSAPADPVFPEGLGNYWKALKAWKATCRRAGIADCRLHDLRHTFGVHAARAGVPLARLQRLMGHASPAMTMRYMRHSPNGDFAADAALVAESMMVSGDREAVARATLAHRRLARA